MIQQGGNSTTRLLLIGGGAYLLYRILKGSEQSSYTSIANACANFHESKLSFAEINYHAMSDILEQSFWDSIFTEDDSLAADTLMMAENVDDVMKLICVYGKRGRGILIKDLYDLPQTVAGLLDADLRNEVNEDYQTKGINFAW